jgi:hypothetical protein
MSFEKTWIDLGGITIYEPVTVITDLLVTAVCWYAFFRLGSFKQGKLQLLFRAYFFSMGLATAYGGIVGHGFIEQLGFVWKVPGWVISMISVALLERAAIFHAQPLLQERIGRVFAWLNLTELFVLLITVLITLNFFWVEAHAAYGLLMVVFSFEMYVFRKTAAIGSRYMLIAVGIAALAALVHLSEFAPHTWFNHLDLSHVIMALGSWYFYQGAVHILDEQKA